jgi:hypothetical protein
MTALARAKKAESTAPVIVPAVPVVPVAPRVWWRRPRAQAGLAAAALVLAAFSAVMLGTVHGLQNRLARLEGTQPRNPAAPGPVLALWLPPGLTRAAGGEIPRLPEAEVAAGVRATLVLPATIAPPAAAAAALADADGKILWTSGALTLRDRTATVMIPAGLLRRGDFQIVLRGGVTTTTLVDLATYDIRVIN